MAALGILYEQLYHYLKAEISVSNTTLLTAYMIGLLQGFWRTTGSNAFQVAKNIYSYTHLYLQSISGTYRLLHIYYVKD